MNYCDLSKKIYDICANVGKKGSKERKIYMEFSNGEKIRIEDGVYMQMSKDCMCAYIWRTFPDQVRHFVKVVPIIGYTPEEIEKMLRVQRWSCV